MKDNKISDSHDCFVRTMMQRKEAASGFFKQYIPISIYQQLDFKSLEVVKDSFVDKELSRHYSDILYKIDLAGKESFIYLLIEHKSYVDRLIAFQILRNMVKIWELYLKQHRRAKKLPVILPLALYHGKFRWNLENRFRVLFDEIKFSGSYIPDYSFEVIDISHMPDENIRGEILVRTFLLLLKYIKSDKLTESLPGILELMNSIYSSRSPGDYIEIFLRYLFTNVGADKKEEVVQQIENSMKSGGDIMISIADELIREGELKGELKGKLEGKLEDAEKMILKNMSNADIRDITGLSIKKIADLRGKVQKS
jgi:predicted transposase/invertase (TIGR01784 family)